MSDFAKLLLNGGVYFRMVVAVEIRPDGRVCVEVGAAVDIAQHRAFAFDKDDGLGLEPVTHLRERMPDVTMIEFSQAVHVPVWPKPTARSRERNRAIPCQPSRDKHNTKVHEWKTIHLSQATCSQKVSDAFSCQSESRSVNPNLEM